MLFASSAPRLHFRRVFFVPPLHQAQTTMRSESANKTLLFSIQTMSNNGIMGHDEGPFLHFATPAHMPQCNRWGARKYVQKKLAKFQILFKYLQKWKFILTIYQSFMCYIPESRRKRKKIVKNFANRSIVLN
jgi:hypothetical protein